LQIDRKPKKKYSSSKLFAIGDSDMSIPNHSILPVSASDLPTLANFVRLSKLPLTINRLLFKDWPNESAQIAVYTNSVESAFKDPSIDFLKVVDDISGEILGHLVLTRKRSDNTELSKREGEGEGNQQIPDGFEPEVYAAVVSAGTEVHKAVEGIDHFGRLILHYVFEK
jgi:hypothetical protein